MKHKSGVWYSPKDIPGKDEQYDAMAFCISGKKGQIAYDRAIFLDENNCFEDGKFYIAGNYCKDLTIHGWYLIPEMEGLKGGR